MRKYLLTFAYKSDAKKEQVLDELKPVLEEVDGKIIEEEEMPLKKLAYEINKSNEANFYKVVLTGSTELPSKLTELLRINDYLLRYMITTISEKEVAKKEVVKEGKE